jgi:hypothetical protein
VGQTFLARRADRQTLKQEKRAAARRSADVTRAHTRYRQGAALQSRKRVAGKAADDSNAFVFRKRA